MHCKTKRDFKWRGVLVDQVLTMMYQINRKVVNFEILVLFKDVCSNLQQILVHPLVFQLGHQFNLLSLIYLIVLDKGM